MHQRHRRHGQRVLQVLVEAAHVMRQQQALVDHGAGGEAGHVELVDGRQLVLLGQRGQRVLRLLPDGEDLALEMIGVADVRARGDDRLADQRHAIEHGLAQARRIGRHIAPAKQLLAFDLDEVFELLDHDLARLGLARQEAHGNGILAGLRQGDASGGGPFAEQRIGNLDQDAGAIAHQGIGAHRAAMVEVDQELEAQPDDLMAPGALDVGDKAHAAGVVLIAGVIKTLSCRQTHSRPQRQ